MHPRNPFFSGYPVRMSLPTAQQAATGEVHPDDGATMSTIASTRSETYRSHENRDRVERIIAMDFLPTQLPHNPIFFMDETSDSPPRAALGNMRIPFARSHGDSPSRSLPIERKRRLTEYGAEADTRRAKRQNLHVQTGASHELILPGQMETTETADTMSGLAKINDDLRAALFENEGLRAQIRDLQARNGQITNRLRDLQELVDTVKNMLADDSE